MSIGEKAKALRADRHWTLSYVSSLADVSLSHLSAIENGTRPNPSFQTMSRIAKVYSVPLTHFEDHSESEAQTSALESSSTYEFSLPLFDEATREFLVSESAPRYLALARHLSQRGALEDTAALLGWIAEYLREEKTIYHPPAKE